MTGSPAPQPEREQAEVVAARSDHEPVEFPALIAALRAAKGNVAQAALLLGISRQRVYRLMQGHSVDLDSLRSESEP